VIREFPNFENNNLRVTSKEMTSPLCLTSQSHEREEQNTWIWKFYTHSNILAKILSLRAMDYFDLPLALVLQ